MFATRDRLSEQVKLGELNIRNQLVNTIADVVKQYYLIVRQKQQLRAIDEQMQVNEEKRVKQAEKNSALASVQNPNSCQAKLDLNAQTRASRVAQQNLIEQVKEQLNGLAGNGTGHIL